MVALSVAISALLSLLILSRPLTSSRSLGVSAKADVVEFGAHVVGEVGLDHTDFADDLGSEEFDQLRGLRMTAIHERFHEEHLRPPRCLDDRETFGPVGRQRLFAEHMFAGLGRLDRPFGVHVVGERDVDRVHARVGKHAVIAGVALGNLELVAEFVGGGLRAARDGGHPAEFGMGDTRGKDASDAARAQDAPVQR